MFTALERIIIKMLAEKPYRTVADLYSRCCHVASQSTFYRVVGELVEQHVFVKKDQKISLNQTWIMEYLRLGEMMKTNYLQEENFLDMQEGQMNVYTGTSLVNIDPLRGDCISKLTVKYGQEHDRYYYNSHPYHMLGMRKTENRFHTLTAEHTNNVYFLFGNDGVLDGYGADILSLAGIKTLCLDETEFPKEGYFLNIINDTIIQLTMPAEISDYFAFVFKQTNTVDEFNVGLFEQMCRMKGDYKLRISRDAIRAKELSKKIVRYFKKDAAKKK